MERQRDREKRAEGRKQKMEINIVTEREKGEMKKTREREMRHERVERGTI